MMRALVVLLLAGMVEDPSVAASRYEYGVAQWQATNRAESKTHAGTASLLTASDIAARLSEAWDTGNVTTLPHEQGRTLVARLRKAAADDPSARLLADYFEARLEMIDGDHGSARPAFMRIASDKAAVAFPGRGKHWRQHLTVQQAARLELGRLADIAGMRDEAVRNYTLLLDELARDTRSVEARYMAIAVRAVRALVDAPWKAPSR